MKYRFTTLSLVFELIAVGRSYFIQSADSDSETKAWFDKIKLVCETKMTKGIETGNLQVFQNFVTIAVPNSSHQRKEI
jgi:hypothetical protein